MDLKVGLMREAAGNLATPTWKKPAHKATSARFHLLRCTSSSKGWLTSLIFDGTLSRFSAYA